MCSWVSSIKKTKERGHYFLMKYSSTRTSKCRKVCQRKKEKSIADLMSLCWRTIRTKSISVDSLLLYLHQCWKNVISKSTNFVSMFFSSLSDVRSKSILSTSLGLHWVFNICLADKNLWLFSRHWPQDHFNYKIMMDFSMTNWSMISFWI